MGKLLKKAWDILVSRNLAVVLLLVVTLMLAIGALLPNPALISEDYKRKLQKEHPIIYKLGEEYNSQKMARGYFFGIVASFLVISTSMCSIDRLVTRYKNRRRAKTQALSEIPEEKGRLVSLKGRSIDVVEEKITNWLRRYRYKKRVVEAGERRMIIGNKGDAGFWGSIFFHFILIASLVGVAIYYFGGYRAQFVFTEGFPYRLTERMAVYIEKKPLWGGLPLPDAEVGLQRQESRYAEFDPRYPIEHIAEFQVRELSRGRVWKKVVKINDPLVIEGKKFLLMFGGYSPRLVITDKEGKKILDSFINLGGSEGMEDSISLPEHYLDIEMHLYPDFEIKDGKPATKTLYLNNPVLDITVYTGGKKIKKRLYLHGLAKVGDFTIHFPEARKWVKMELVGEPGVGFFFVLAFFGILGVVVRFIDPDEKVFFILRNEEMTVLSVTRHFQGLTDQRIEELVEAVGR